MTVKFNSKPIEVGVQNASVGVGGVVAFLWIDRSPRYWNETLMLLSRIDRIGAICVAGPDYADLTQVTTDGAKVRVLREKNLVGASRAAFAIEGEFHLFVSTPVRPSLDALDLALDWMGEDPRLGTMSFLSNAGGYLSFPHRNTETPFGVDEHDEVSLTNLLRSRRPTGARPVPVPVAEGAMVMVSRSALDLCEGLVDDGTENLPYALVDLSMRCARRGFNNYLDPFTFLTVPFDGFGLVQSILKNHEARHSLAQRHPHLLPSYDSERNRPNSVLGQSLDRARSVALGLRVLIDGSVLGPKEMGTQVLIVNLTKALAARSEIQWVAVGVPDPNDVPAYAEELKSLRKVRLVPAGHLDFPEGPMVDIIHRPFQPTAPIPWDRWNELSKRSIITVQDLIAYRNGAYFKDWSEWDRYRENFNRQVARCDAVISISHDVVTPIREERLPVDDQRVFVVENGADHRSKDEAVRVPNAIIAKGWASSSFLFVLGATYAHKNRDVAIRVWRNLRAKGHKHKLVLVGAAVPYGSSRIEEAAQIAVDEAESILILPEVASEERNWLLRYSSLAVYLTAAEGFGLIPFEAARLGVPTLHVSFGPLRELIDDPTLPTSYDVDDLTARADLLLTDEKEARAAVAAALKNIDRLTWAETARKTVDAYFAVLDQPARTFRI